MSETLPDAEALVEEGLQLYSQGELDKALDRWRSALQQAPDLALALEYIKYVEENRELLEQTFGTTIGNDGPGEAGEVTAVKLAAKKQAEEEEAAGVDFVAFEDGTESRRERKQTSVTLEDHSAQVPPASVGGLEPFAPDELTPVSLTPSSLGIAQVDQVPKPAPRVPRVTPHSLPPEGRDQPMFTSADQAVEVRPPAIGLDPEEAVGVLADVELLVHEATPDSMVRAEEPPKRRAADAGPPPLPEDLVGPAKVGRTELKLSSQGPGFIGLEDLPTSDEEAATALEPEGFASSPPEEEPPEADSLEGEERVDTMLLGAKQLHDQGTYEGSLWLCEKILTIDAGNAETVELQARNQEVLQKQYEAKLNDLEAVPVVRVSMQEIVWHKLDHRAGFLLSRVDGQLTFSEILDISGMPLFEATRILAQLVEQGVIGDGT